MKTKIIYILVAIIIFSSCAKRSSEIVNDTAVPGTCNLSESEIQYFEAIREFNWSSYDEKPFLYENIFSHECRVFVCDIDEDKIPEILLTEIYSPREANATEILKFENGEYVSACGFWGNFYNDEKNISLYENQNKEKVLISKTSSYHGGMKNTLISEVNVSSFSYKVLYGKTDYDSGEEKYFIINEEKGITRDFIDSGFSGCIETDKENFCSFLIGYENSLTFIKEIPFYDCGFLSLENLPTSDMLIDEDFNYNEYMKNKDSFENIKKSNDKIAEEIILKINES